MSRLSWNKDFSPKQVCDGLESYRVDPSKMTTYMMLENSKKAAFHGTADRAFAVVAGALKWPKGIDADEREAITTSGIAQAAIKNDLSPKSVLQECELAFSRHKRRRKHEHVVVSSLTLPPGLGLRSRTVAGVKIRFCSSRNRQWDLEEMRRTLDSLFPRGWEQPYLQLEARLGARNVNEAMAEATRAVDTLRGLWCLYMNAGRWSRSYGKQARLAQVSWGPVTSVHKPSGPLFEETFRYNDSHQEKRSFARRETLQRALNYEKRVLRRLNRSKCRDHITSALAAYAGALDKDTGPEQFLALWAVLEHLTGGLQRNYDKNAGRMLWCFDTEPANRTFLTQELRYLRDFRNTLVHRGKIVGEVDVAVQQALSYADACLSAWINVLHESASVEEALSVMDLPPTKTSLKKLDLRVRKSLRWRKH